MYVRIVGAFSENFFLAWDPRVQVDPQMLPQTKDSYTILVLMQSGILLIEFAGELRMATSTLALGIG
jgi:hypothetical protein